MKDQDPRTEALDNVAKTGKKVTLRAAVAFQNHPDRWMSVAEVADIIGLAPITVEKHSVRELFNLQIVEKKYEYDEDLEPTAKYKLRTMDDELEELAERAESSLRTKKKKRKISSGLAVVDGGTGVATGNK